MELDICKKLSNLKAASFLVILQEGTWIDVLGLRGSVVLLLDNGHDEKVTELGERSEHCRLPFAAVVGFAQRELPVHFRIRQRSEEPKLMEIVSRLESLQEQIIDEWFSGRDRR